jgi:starch-binding outer membrane protein, SusD/RagB family
MRHSFRVLLGLGLAMGAAGCSDYLSGPGVSSTSDPNNVTTLTKAGPLYVGVQEAGPVQREGQIARYATAYMQQIAGVARQSVAFDHYLASPGDVDTYFGAIYGSSNVVTGGGGLLDVHKMQQLARKLNDSLYVGIGKVYEALIIGYAADIWGDIPYREAADSTILQPHFDGQLQVYADLQTQLDSAINIFLTATGPTNAGGAVDGSELIYLNRTSDQLRVVYTAVAHSLKARYYMHTAATNPAAYALALSEAQLGISTPLDDFLWFHDGTPVGQNIWWQYNGQRAGDIVPGAAVIEILKRRITAGLTVEDSARIKFYFDTAAGGTYFGRRPEGNTALPGGAGGPGGTFSFFNTFIDGGTAPGDFRQPELTFAETKLIAAEAAFHAGGAGAAQPFLDAARANRAYGSSGGIPITFPPLPSIPATLQNIMEEKYVTLYLNPEVWNDWKRTCLPSLAPAPASTSSTTPGGAGPIPGRLPYGQTEINANPNTPSTNSAGVAVTSTGLNPNQPAACPVLNYTTSTPLAN